MLDEVVAAISGALRAGTGPRSVGGVSIDSRTIEPEQLFFAIRGPRFDGHAFVGAALQRGAVAAVVAQAQVSAVAEALREAGRTDVGERLIRVDDPTAALGRLAAYHRRQLSAQVIAVVGSNGKTTTKAMIHHVLGGGLRGQASPKSFNNVYGVPLTLLSANAGDDYLVVEVGTNARGEIAALGALVQPDAVVLTSIGEEHLEGLGDLAGVADEECAILPTVPAGGLAAVNVDSAQVAARLDGLAATVVTFGRSATADLRVTDVRYDAPWLRFRLNGRFDYRIKLPGTHNAINAAGAIAVGRRFGLEHEAIAARLETFAAPPMRTELIELAGVTIVNDAYNANPASALAALETLVSLPCAGRRMLVLGEMRELGGHAAREHRRIAEQIAAAQIDRVFVVGEAATEWMQPALGGGRLFGPEAEFFAAPDACAARLAAEVAAGDVVLLKASRAVGLERVLEPLRGRSPAPAA